MLYNIPGLFVWTGLRSVFDDQPQTYQGNQDEFNERLPVEPL